jgi:DNA polymerase-3 subunit alpha
MTHFLKELAPTTIFDINAMVALYRPGPLEMIPEYIKRKHDPSLIQYLDPRLETILDQSFGVITYQDDVMLIAIHLAGYSWLEADKLRKAMGKKIPAEMQAQKEKLLDGFVAHGLSKKLGAELWRLIEPFAAYGFNKAHAASYGRVAYQTAYMKANFPVAYMTAVLTNESGDIDKVSEIVIECKRMGLDVLPPNVNSSFGGFSIVGDKIVTTDEKLSSNESGEKILFGLYTVKGLGTDISDAIIKEREENGPYTSFENFIARVNHKNLNKRSLESLAMCGALDTLANRADILHNMEEILKYHKDVIKDNGNQSSLFGEHHATTFTLKKGVDIEPAQKLIWEKELLGLYVSGFPLDPWKEKIKARGLDIDYILHKASLDESISFPCLIDNIRVTKTKKGDPMAIVKVRDFTASIEIAVFPETYKKVKAMCVQDATVVVKGKVAERNNERTLVADDITELKVAEK